MTNKFLQWPLVIGLFLLAIGLAGCGQQAVQEEAPAGATGASIISGKLYAGVIAASVQASSIRAYANSPTADKTVVAVAKDSGKIYFSGKSGSDGSFSLNVPASKTYMLAIMDEYNKLQAPIALAAGNSVTMGLSAESGAVDLGEVVIDENKSSAAPTKEPSAYLDTSLTAVSKTGEALVPVAAGNLGKGSEAQTGSSGTGIDGDQDGLPNILDADNDGDGIIDELDAGSGAATEGSAGSSKIDAATLFTNLKIAYDRALSFDPATDTVITIELIPDASTVSNISSVVVTAAPTYAAIATIREHPSDYLEDDAYPATSSLWPRDAGDNYKLYKIHTSSADYRWIVFLQPNISLEAGDLFRFRVNFTDGTSEECLKMINYVFGSIPKLVTYTLAGSSETTAPTTIDMNNPFELAGTTEVTLKWQRPKDELGNDIDHLKYEYHIFYYSNTDFQQTGLINTSADIKTVISSDSGAGAYLATPYTLPTTYNGTAVQAYQVDITARSEPGGDNAAQILYFKRL